MARGKIHVLQVEHGKRHAEQLCYLMHRQAGRGTTSLHLDEFFKSTRKRQHVYMSELSLDTLDTLDTFLTFLARESL